MPQADHRLCFSLTCLKIYVFNCVLILEASHSLGSGLESRRAIVRCVSKTRHKFCTGDFCWRCSIAGTPVVIESCV